MSDMPQITQRQIDILRHALGCGNPGVKPGYRNRYVIGPECDGWSDLMALLALKLVRDHGAQEVCGGMHIFSVTDSGKEMVSAVEPKPKKISSGARRYQEFLHSDTGLTFREWLHQQRLQKDGVL